MNGQAKKALLISSGQPSLNPRLVKEADALAEAGFEVTVLYAYWNAWATQFDQALLTTKKWRAVRVGGAPEEKPFVYLLSRIIFKIATLFTRFTGSMALVHIAIARSGLFLIKESKRHQADIYIGHNLGALAATVKAAGKYGKPCGFDAEDFHRNEVSDDPSNTAAKLAGDIEDKYIPQLRYLTASSPLISQKYATLYHRPVETLLNTFPKQAVKITKPDKKLKLFWFSQTIGSGRGLETLLDALRTLDDDFELHLLGNITDEIEAVFSNTNEMRRTKFYFHQPIPSTEIINFASQFDIGIASELTKPLNRNICLTNKLFTYIQAGLAVLASDTSAQTAFMEQHHIGGKLYRSVDDLIKILTYYKNNPDILWQHKMCNFQLGQADLNWDQEKVRFLNMVNRIIDAE